MERKKSKIDRCCCTCDRNKRIEDPKYGLICVCEIDGHHISYVGTRWIKRISRVGSGTNRKTLNDSIEIMLRNGNKR